MLTDIVFVDKCSTAFRFCNETPKYAYKISAMTVLSP